MFKIIFLLLFLATVYKKPIKFNDITPEIFQDPTAVVELTAGDTIPLQFWIKGDLFSLDMNENEAPILVVQKTFYVKCVDETFLFSSDRQNWKEWFEFVTGSLGVSVPNEKGAAGVTFYLEADERT